MTATGTCCEHGRYVDDGEHCADCGTIAPPHAEEERRPTSWAPVDLNDVIGQPMPPPRYLARADGTALFYTGRDHTLFGPSGSHKSWVAVITAAEALRSPDERVAYIDLEDTAHGIVSRLESLAIDADLLLDASRFRYVRPNEPVGPNRSGLLPPGAVDLADLVDWAPTLVIIDGVTESLAIEGLNGNDGGDVARWFLLISRRFTDAGAAVVTLDHTAKANGDGTPSELGSQHKRAGLSGASFFVDAPNPLKRASGPEPEEGLVRLRLMKDRVGWLAGSHPGPRPVVADIELTAWPDGAIDYAVVSADADGSETVDRLAGDLARFLFIHRDAGGQSRSAIAEGIGRNRTDNKVGAKLTYMAGQGWLRVTDGPRGANLYSLTALGTTGLAASLEGLAGEEDTRDE